MLYHQWGVLSLLNITKSREEKLNNIEFQSEYLFFRASMKKFKVELKAVLGKVVLSE